jgi:hypothetical protein
MKKLIGVLAFVSVFFFSNAQEGDRVFKPFRVDIAFGYAIPSGPGSKIGICFITEPKYAIQDQIQIGLRLETALIGRAVGNENTASVSVTANGSYTATTDYYFNTNKFRPFAGGGIGLCRTHSIAVAITDPNQGEMNISIGAESKFLGLIRTGSEFGHGRLSIEYNCIPKSIYTGSTNADITVRNSYIAFNLGIDIGGGRYKK